MGQPERAPRYRWVDWREMSPELAVAVVAAEDQRFRRHHGLDFEAIDDALDARRNGGRLRGASTISQQVAKNLFLWPGRSLVRKGLEGYLAVLIELTWSKRRILEVYLNVAEFGDGVYGVGVASELFFARPPSRLSTADRRRCSPPCCRARSVWMRGTRRRMCASVRIGFSPRWDQLGGVEYLGGM